MGRIFLNIVTAILIVSWIIGFFFYDTGAKIHILLLLALILTLLRILIGRNYQYSDQNRGKTAKP